VDRSWRPVTHPLPAMEREVGPPYAFPEDIAKLGPDEVNRPVPWSEAAIEAATVARLRLEPEEKR